MPTLLTLSFGPLKNILSGALTAFRRVFTVARNKPTLLLRAYVWDYFASCN